MFVDRQWIVARCGTVGEGHHLNRAPAPMKRSKSASLVRRAEMITVALMMLRAFIVFAMLATPVGLSACTTGSGQGATLALAAGDVTGTVEGDQAVDYDDNALSEGKASWRCDNGETYLVDNTVSQIVVSAPDGQTMQMPATPADSRTRYVLQQYAFVVDGEEALFFRPKASPLTCKKGPAAAYRVTAPPSIDLKLNG
jgi:membrane-bound inhibitor of C-type lysozyme